MLKEKEKVWFEFRINIGGISKDDVPMYMAKISNNLRSKDGSVMTIFTPVRDEESNVRLLYDPNGKHNKQQLKLAKQYMEIAIKEYNSKI